MPYTTNPHDGVRIYYETVGTGPPVILLHGLSQTGSSWRRNGLIDGLQDAHTLIPIDARAHGQSDGTHDPTHHGGFPAMAADVVAVLDALALNTAHVIGYSMGAVTGYALGRDAPERLRSLVLGGGPYQLDEELRHGLIEAARQGPQALIVDYEASLDPLPADRIEELEQLDWPAQVAATTALGASPPLTQAEFAAFRVPCFLFSGDRDTLALDQVRQIAAWIPDAELHILPGLDHNQTNADATSLLSHIHAFLHRADALP